MARKHSTANFDAVCGENSESLVDVRSTETFRQKEIRKVEQTNSPVGLIPVFIYIELSRPIVFQESYWQTVFPTEGPCKSIFLNENFFVWSKMP